MKIQFFILSIFLISAQAWSQDYDYVRPDSIPNKEKKSNFSLPIKSKQQPVYVVPSYVDKDKKVEPNPYWQDTPDDQVRDEGKTSVNLELGTSVSSDFNGNTAINTYVAPNVRREINDRVAISVGMMMSQTFFDGWKNYSFDGGPMPSTVYNNMVYGSIEYKVSDRMLVYGTVYQNITTMPLPGGTRNFDGQGVAAGMKYKMSEKSFLQVHIQASQGYNPYMPCNNNFSPYSNFGFGGRPISYFP